MRCIIAEDTLSTNLETVDGEQLKHDYVAIFAVIEVCCFIPQVYSVYVYFRWKTHNTQATRAGIPKSNLAVLWAALSRARSASRAPRIYWLRIDSARVHT